MCNSNSCNGAGELGQKYDNIGQATQAAISSKFLWQTLWNWGRRRVPMQLGACGGLGQLGGLRTRAQFAAVCVVLCCAKHWAVPVYGGEVTDAFIPHGALLTFKGNRGRAKNRKGTWNENKIEIERSAMHLHPRPLNFWISQISLGGEDEDQSLHKGQNFWIYSEFLSFLGFNGRIWQKFWDWVNFGEFLEILVKV